MSNKETISRLKFIGKIQKSEKINVRYMIIQPEGFLTKISRSIFNQCNRVNTLNFIRTVISQTFEIIEDYSKANTTESNKYIRVNIITDLKQAKIGLINIKETYIYDSKFICDIDTVIEEIDAKMQVIEK